MPLIIISGFPSSGKSTRTEQLREYFTSKCEKVVNIVSDHTIDVNRNDVYSDSRKEKEVRGKMKAEVQRLISKDTVTILDSANYIKGYRYELYCVTKSAQTPHCVVHCDVSEERVKQWNEIRSDAEQYTEQLLDELIMRYERPVPTNRWDAPLFAVGDEDDLPAEQIREALFDRRAPPPNLSTQSQPLSSTDFLYELDRVSKEVVDCVMSAQKTAVPGDEITVPPCKEKVCLTNPLTLSELQRHRRQFITYTKLHPMDVQKIGSSFVQYLNSSIR